MKADKYEELDKRITAEVMKEFDGKIIEHECPSCHAKPVNGHVCNDCNGDGFYSIQYGNPRISLTQKLR